MGGRKAMKLTRVEWYHWGIQLEYKVVWEGRAPEGAPGVLSP